MKKILWLFAVLAASCSNGNDRNGILYQSYGVIKEDAGTSGKLYIRSDEGKIIILSPGLMSNEDRDKRVWVRFFTDDDVKLDTIRANVYDLLKITSINFKKENDDLTSDEVRLLDIWVAQDYLTLIMDVTAGSDNSLKDHLYTMYSDTIVANDTVHMEFKYDRKSDDRSKRFNKIVALKLDDKISPAQGSDSVIMAIKYRTDSGFKEQHITYKK